MGHSEIAKKHLELLIQQEGYKEYPYMDSLGHLTIGIGRNLEKKGISHNEALYLLNNDIDEIKYCLYKYLPFYAEIDEVRQGVLINMSFNLGGAGMMCFNKFLTALINKDYKKAAQEMINSKWYKQLPERVKMLSVMMETGKFI